jgi:hypothetical protein
MLRAAAGTGTRQYADDIIRRYLRYRAQSQ